MLLIVSSLGSVALLRHPFRGFSELQHSDMLKCYRYGYRSAKHTKSKIRTRELRLYNNNPLYLERMVERKKVEVDSLLRRHQEPDDPLVMRMSYMASECLFNVTKSLKKDGHGKEGLHTMSVMVDVKRRSPTVIERRNVVEYSTAGKFCELLTRAKTDAFMINTDEMEYGGSFPDLKESVQAVREVAYSTKSISSNPPPAIIQKDIIIHPVQIAQALENGAAGVLLIVAVVGGDLEVLLDACTIMGTEAVVEVHTPNELEFALSKGATIFLVNMWDRMSGQLFTDQAKGLASMMPMNALSIAAGNIHSVEQVAELGFYGYDSVVLGRNIADVPDIKGFIDGVHSFRGAPRSVMRGMGMKGMNWDTGGDAAANR